MTWLRQLLENEQHQGPQAFLEALKVDLFEDEVFVFTPKGEVKNLSAGSTPLDFAYAVHTDVGHRCVGAKVNGKIVPLHYQLRSGDIVEVLTAKQGRGPSRDWLKLVRTSRHTAGLAELTPRERDVLALMAEGRSNAGIAAALVITESVVEKHVASIFAKLRLPPSQADNRRVLAVLRFLAEPAVYL